MIYLEYTCEVIKTTVCVAAVPWNRYCSLLKTEIVPTGQASLLPADMSVT